MIALMLAAALAADKPQAFDLVCSGKAFEALSRASGKLEPYNVRIHIDLSQKLWAFASQDVPRRLARVSDAEIVFRDEVGPYGHSVLVMNRTTGTLTNTDDKNGESINAKCEPAPFTALPKPKPN